MLDSRLKNYDWFHLAVEILYFKHVNYDLAIEVADQAFEQSKTQSDLIAALSLTNKATAYFKKGDIVNAIKVQEESVKYAKRSKEGNLKYFEDQLYEYKKTYQVSKE